MTRTETAQQTLRSLAAVADPGQTLQVRVEGQLIEWVVPADHQPDGNLPPGARRPTDAELADDQVAASRAPG